MHNSRLKSNSSYVERKRRSLKKLFLEELDRISFGYVCRHSVKNLKSRYPQLCTPAFDYIGNLIEYTGIYEINSLNFLFNAFHEWSEIFKSSTIIDVGANFGNHTLYFSNIFENVIAYEANPRTYEILKLNKKLAVNKNINIHNVGISKGKGEISFHLPDQANLGSFEIYKGDNKEYSKKRCINLPVSSLDECIGNQTNVKMIKIDVQGMENDVLLGGEELIKRCKPVILFEQTKEDFRDGSSDCLETLNKMGYKHFMIINEYPKPIKELPAWLGRIFNLTKIFFYGSTVRLDDFKYNHIPKGNYEFIIATPDWMY